LAGGAALLLLLATAAHSQPDPLQAWSGRGSAVAVPTAGEVRLERPGRQPLALPVPAGSDVTSLAVLGAGWVAAGTFPAADGRERLWLVAGDDEPLARLPEPPAQAGLLRQGPVLLVRRGRLVGLAWLEGDGGRSLAVRAAAWTGSRWSRAEKVSAVGPGSQLALAAGVLDDGSWLLVWSAFDGQDDEVVGSRRIDGRWQPVERLCRDNDVPDITPALAPVPGGALAAWSRFDGNDYRVVTARFDGDRWIEERTIAEPGSLYPAFGGPPGSLHLLYLTARPRGWSLIELSQAGEIRARGSVVTDLDVRPIVGKDGDGMARLRWPGLAEQRISLEEQRP
jgi:hypothetical protein